jgi:hypothetical protein
MSNTVVSLKEDLRRWVLLIGVAQVLFGCLVGFIPPTAAWRTSSSRRTAS